MALLAQHPHLPRLVAHETLAGSRRLTPMLERWIAPAFARGLELALGGRFEGRAGPSRRARALPRRRRLLHEHLALRASSPARTRSRAAALARQTRFLRELVALLFPDEAPDTP